MKLLWQKNRVATGGRLGVVAALAGLGTVAIVGCVYDTDARCSDNQVLTEEGTAFCVCPEGSAWTEAGCVECGDNEIAGPAGCTCDAGYGRPDPASACEACGDNEATGANGACECAPGYARTAAGEPCEEAAPTGDDTTSGTACSSDADCTDGAQCDLDATPPFCRQPPTGLNQPCTAPADCAGTEATYCDTFVTMSCLVQGCTLAPDNCFPGTECCDLTSYGITEYLCVEEGECAT